MKCHVENCKNEVLPERQTIEADWYGQCEEHAQKEEKKIFMTEQWTCPQCNFPENFTPTCSLCNYENEKAAPESEESRKKFAQN